MARTWKRIRLVSTGSACSTEITSSTTVAPAGMTAPLLPTVAVDTVAVNLSPTRADVHVRPFVVIPTRAPTPMTPGAGPGAGVAGAGLGARSTGVGGVGRGVRTTGAGDDSRLGAGVGRGVGARRGVGASGATLPLIAPPTGASLNTVCGGASRCAMARSRTSAESVAPESELARSRHAASSASAERAGRNRMSERMAGSAEGAVGTVVHARRSSVPAWVTTDGSHGHAVWLRPGAQRAREQLRLR